MALTRFAVALLLVACLVCVPAWAEPADELSPPPLTEELLQMKQEVEAQNTPGAYKHWAKVCLANGQIDEWIAAKKKVMELQGFNENQTLAWQSWMIYDLMDRGFYDRAWPLAQQNVALAAQVTSRPTGADFHAAAVAAEVNGKYPQAYAWLGGTWWNQVYLLMWCQHTGHGNHRAARQGADRWAKQRNGIEREGREPYLGIYYMLIGEPDVFRAMLEKRFVETHNPFDGLLAAMLYDKAENRQQRDTLIQQVIERGHQFDQSEYKWRDSNIREEAISLAKLMQDALKQGEQAMFSMEAYEQNVFNRFGVEKLRLPYLAGLFALNRGNTESAKQFFIVCLHINRHSYRTPEYFLSSIELRKLGDDPVKEQQFNFDRLRAKYRAGEIKDNTEHFIVDP